MELMKSLLPLRTSVALLASSFFLLFSAVAYADVDVTTPDQLIPQIVQLINDWRSLGAIAGLVGVVNFLITFTKLPFISSWIDAPDAYSKDKKWIRPILSILSAGLISMLAAKNTGASLVLALGHGILAGMGSIGFHEIVDAVASIFERFKARA